MRLAVDDVTGGDITVGGALTIGGEKKSSAASVPPRMAKNPPRVIREIYNK